MPEHYYSITFRKCQNDTFWEIMNGMAELLQIWVAFSKSIRYNQVKCSAVS